MSYLTIGRLILAGVSKSKIISKYSKKAYDEYYKKYDNAFKLEQLVRTYEQRKVA